MTLEAPKDPGKEQVSVRAADLIPLAPGNVWIYRNQESGATFEVRVIGMASVSRRVYHVVSGYGAGTLMLRARENGSLVYWDDTYSEERVAVEFRGRTGETYPVHGRGCFTRGCVVAADRTYEGPAGKWRTIAVSYEAEDIFADGQMREYFAENIGMVRRVVITQLGPQVFDLVYAQVGRQVITAGETGRFAVVALPGADGRSWDVRMITGPSGGSGMKLRFATDQQYELRLRDAEANVLWTWSAGKHFQRNPQFVNTGSYSSTVNVPHPQESNEDRSYALEAWLTVEEEEPRFAVAATLKLPGTGESRN